MEKVIELNKYRESEIDRIEEKVYLSHGIIKVKEDLYLYPEVSFTSGTADLDFFIQDELGMSIEELLEEDLIEEINNLVTMRKQKISVMLMKKEGDWASLEIFNSSNNKRFILTTPMNDNENTRKIMAGIVAGAINRHDVEVIYFLRMNYNEMREITGV